MPAAGDGAVGDGLRRIADQVGLAEYFFGGRGGLFLLFAGEGHGRGGQGGRRGFFGFHGLLRLRIDAALDSHIENFCLFVLLHDEFDGLIAVLVENSVENILVFQSHEDPSLVWTEKKVYDCRSYFKR